MPSFLDRITPMILTYNEAPNIGRCLERLKWARSVLVVDSFSTDETLDVIRSFSQVTLVQRSFDTPALQCNYGLRQIRTPWVLSMDADYILSDDFIRELQGRPTPDAIDGYSVRIQYSIYGKPIRSGIYPPRTVLYRREKASYYDDGHTQRVAINGRVESLRSFIYHDDWKGFDRWLQSQQRYTRLESQKIRSCRTGKLGARDRIRKTLVLAPFLVMAYCLFVRGGILDGWRGWYYALQRGVAEGLLSLQLLDAAFISLPSPDRSEVLSAASEPEFPFGKAHRIHE